MIEVSIDTVQVLNGLNRLSNVDSAINFELIAAKSRQNIIDRTGLGKDVNNNDFAPYSAAYLREKSLTHDDITVNLQYSNSMLGSISFDSDNNSALVFFLDRENSEKAKKHNLGEGGLPKREFFGLSTDDKEEIQAMMFDDINRYLSQI